MSVSVNGGTERTSSAARSGITNTSFETMRNALALSRILWLAPIHRSFVCGRYHSEEAFRESPRDRRGGAVRPRPYSFKCLPLLPEEPASHEATGHQQSARAKREQRGSAGTTGLRKLSLRSRSRGRSRGRRRSSLRRRRRSGSGRRRGRSARGLGHNSSGLRLYNPILTLGLGLRATSLGLLGLGVGNDGRLVLGESGRSGQQGHRQHRRQYHQLPQSNLPPLARKFVSIGGGLSELESPPPKRAIDRLLLTQS